MNAITDWEWGEPTDEGDYLMCYGDVETPNNIYYIRLERDITGQMVDRSDNSKPFGGDWCDKYKFARLIYAPSDLPDYDA